MSKQMIESHRKQIRELELERNQRVSLSNNVKKIKNIIKSYSRDINAYEDDIKLLENEIQPK